ncbi:MAG: hypothetical protein MK209_01275 [Planctomycetes bacterium]|nr:hypothetical protein [Planctomycetota bacterium]
MPEGQHAENLAWIQEQAQDLRPQSPGMQRLFDRALNGEGELLRISPHRTALRLEAEVHDAAPDGWLLKIAHPRRRGEALRRHFSNAPAEREAEAWRLLAPRLGVGVRVEAQQLRPQLGLFARNYFEGKAAQANDATAAGLARLHHERWVDRDLALSDLLWVKTENGLTLLPLDLGHATVSMLPPPTEKIYLALARILSAMPAEQAEPWASSLLAAHDELLPSWQVEDLLRRSTRTRERRAWQRSRRALRTCSNFIAEGSGVRRRGFEEAPPAWPLPVDAQPLSEGPRSSTVATTQAVWKFYPRSGAWQNVRRSLGAGPGRAAYRALAWLEILALPSSRPLAYLPHPNGEWIASTWVPGEEPTLEQLPKIAGYLSRLHRTGVGLRDAKRSNFRQSASGELILIDVDGITRGVEDAARDLARVIAESPQDDSLTESARASYAAVHAPLIDARFEVRFQERLAAFRSKLAGQQDSAR